MTHSNAIRRTFDAGNGIFRLAPNWVPRSFCIPGRRIKLLPTTITRSEANAAASTNAGSAARLPRTTDR